MGEICAQMTFKITIEIMQRKLLTIYGLKYNITSETFKKLKANITQVWTFLLELRTM